MLNGFNKEAVTYIAAQCDQKYRFAKFEKPHATNNIEFPRY